MDAPPPQENVEPFIEIADFLRKNGFSAPKIFAKDVRNGFLLLEDFGDSTFTRLLNDAHPERDLYKLAIDVLVDLHEDIKDLPDVDDYSEKLLMNEALLLPQWWMKAALGDTYVTKKLLKSFEDVWHPVFKRLKKAPKALVLRDFHVDNLLILNNRSEIAACGLLDFQDAVYGPGIYDVVSLLEDARRDLPVTLVEEMKMRYTRSFEDLEIDAFEEYYAILGAQRHAKVIGIFARLCMRDGKPIYLKHIPRVWRLFERSLRHPALKDVKTWVDSHIPKDKRGIPACLME